MADAKARVAQVAGDIEEVSREAAKARAKAEEAKNEFEQERRIENSLFRALSRGDRHLLRSFFAWSCIDLHASITKYTISL